MPKDGGDTLPQPTAANIKSFVNAVPHMKGAEWIEQWAAMDGTGPHLGHRPARQGDQWLLESWQRDPWPNTDPCDPPDGDDCQAADRPVDRQLNELQGAPLALGGGVYPHGDGEPNAVSRMPKPKDPKQFALELNDTIAMNERMMPAVCEPTSPTEVANVVVRQQMQKQLLIAAGPSGQTLMQQ